MTILTDADIDALNNSPRSKLQSVLQAHKKKNGLDVEQIWDLLAKTIGVRTIPDSPTDAQVNAVLAKIGVSRAEFDRKQLIERAKQDHTSARF